MLVGAGCWGGVLLALFTCEVDRRKRLDIVRLKVPPPVELRVDRRVRGGVWVSPRRSIADSWGSSGSSWIAGSARGVETLSLAAVVFGVVEPLPEGKRE